jgi:hypothetical protein
MNYVPYLFMVAIFGGVIYVAITVVKYMKFVEKAQPKLEKLES